MSGVSASPPSHSSFQCMRRHQTNRNSTPHSSCFIGTRVPHEWCFVASKPGLNRASKLSQLTPIAVSPPPRLRLRCNCSRTPSGPGPSESDSKTVLDAFFLGRALGEVFTERVESVVGEFLSTVGRLQAEQQKQVQEFQEEVFERAKRAKEMAAREAAREKRMIQNSGATNVSNVVNDAGSSTVTSQNNLTSTVSSAPPVAKPNGSTLDVNGDQDRSDNNDSVSEISIDG